MPTCETTECSIGRFLLVLLAAAVTLFSVSAASGQTREAPINSEQVTVYYFHGSIRCETCLLIEALTEGTLRADFSKELASGALVWSSVDVGMPENAHFVSEFGLGGNELVVARQRDGEASSWGEISGLWDLAADPARFSQRLREVVVRFLKMKT